MNILTTISYYTPHISGLTICAQRLIEGLSKREFEFTVLTSQHDRSLPIEEQKDGVTIVRLPVLTTIGKVPVMPSFPFVVWRLIRETDLVWIHVPQAEGLLVAILAKIGGKRVISTVHCLPLLPSGWQRNLCQWLFDLVNNLIILLSDQVVYYTEDYVRNTKELWHYPEKSSYIYPPIPEIKRVQRVRRSEQKNHRLFTVGFVGRVAEDKGLENLFNAREILRIQDYNVRLEIVGPKTVIGESRYLGQLNEMIARYDGVVNFRGELSDKDLIEFYHHIDCLVLPSVNRTEAFGIVQIEAMLCGTPVVTADLAGIRVPIRRTGFGMVVPPRDPQALAKAILCVASIQWERNRMIEKVVNEFSLEKSIRLYESVLRGR